jgi:CubicO group peptidase (beta-lactamase class C family)
MPRLLSLVLLSLLVSTPPAAGAAPTGPDTAGSEATLRTLREILDRRVPELMRAGDVPGLSIAVLRDGKLFWSGAFGVADPSTDAPARPETVFQAASLSKPVFAYTVLRLADRGVLALDTPLVTYLSYPRFADDRTARITARMVLSHSTGLPNWGGDKLKLAFNPGEHFSYSGEGYFYLQKVVEKLTGLPLAELARREVFVPLGMSRTSYVWLGEPAAAGVDDYGDVQTIDPKQDANAAASLLTTAGDYSRFLLAVVTGQGLKPESAAAMLTPQIHVPSTLGDPRSVPRDDMSWGLGWGLVKSGESEVFWHWGHQEAWRAFVAVRRDGRAGLIVFMNSATGLTIARPLADLAGVGGLPVLDWLVYESYDNARWAARRELLRAFTGLGTKAGLRLFAQKRAAAPGVVDAKLAAELAGLLEGSGRGEAAVALLQQNAAPNPSAHDLADLGDAWLAAGDFERALQSYEAAAKLDPSKPRTDEIRWTREGLEMKKHPAELTDEALRKFAGDYGPRHVRLEGGRLVYHRTGRQRSYRLLSGSADTFFMEGKGNQRIRFVTDSGGRVTKLVPLGPEGPQDESPRDP